MRAGYCQLEAAHLHGTATAHYTAQATLAPVIGNQIGDEDYSTDRAASRVRDAFRGEEIGMNAIDSSVDRLFRKLATSRTDRSPDRAASTWL